MNKIIAPISAVVLMIVAGWFCYLTYGKQKHYVVIENRNDANAPLLGVEEWSACGRPTITPTRDGYHVRFTDPSGSECFLTTTGVQVVPDGFDDECKGR